MGSKVEFPIRTKLLLLITGIMLASTAAYLSLALKLFRDDKTSLVYELSASTVKTLAAETEAELSKIADKIKLLTKGHRDAEWVKGVFETEPDLISYSLYKPTADPNHWTVVTSVRNADYLKLYGLPLAEVDRIHEQVPIPFSKILAKRTLVFNSTMPGAAPILSLAMAIDIVGEGGGQSVYVAVADLRSDRILRLLSGLGIVTSYLVDSDGGVIAHPNMDLVMSRASMSDNPLVRAAVDSPVALQIKPFDYNGKKWLGAYAAVGIGNLSVISQIEEAQAFRAARVLIEKSILFALIFLTAGLLISGFVSRSFTDPIQKLLQATERLSRWEFGESIHVKTHDEIASLARSFNAMAIDLQSQRSQIEANRSELELKVKERTAALEAQKKQLFEAQEALLRTTRLASLGELAGAAAHEVLNPVNNMNIRMQRIRDNFAQGDQTDATLLNDIVQEWKKIYDLGDWKSFPAELSKPSKEPKKTMFQEDLENIVSIAKDYQLRVRERLSDLEFLNKEMARVSRIINNMRALSRVGGERRPLDIHIPIDDTVLTLTDLFEKKAVTLVKEFSAESRDHFTVTGDKDELVQVFINLMRNSIQAIDSAKKRAGSLRIGTKRNGQRIEIRLTDNGTGIKKEHLAKIFEPTFTTKSVDEGTGLGLSISRRLVRAFGGDIEVEKSIEGEGTTFLIWFPAAS